MIKLFHFFSMTKKLITRKGYFYLKICNEKKMWITKTSIFHYHDEKKNKFSNSPSKKTNKTDFHNPERIIHHHLKFIRSHTHTLVDGNKYSRYSYVEFYTPINFNGSTVMAKNHHHHQHTNIDKQHSIYIVNLNGKKEFFFLHFLYESKKKKKYSRSIMRM